MESFYTVTFEKNGVWNVNIAFGEYEVIEKYYRGKYGFADVSGASLDDVLTAMDKHMPIKNF